MELSKPYSSCIKIGKFVKNVKLMTMDTAGSIFWFIVILFVIWFIVLVWALVNLFKRDDLTLVAKAFWALIIISFPILGLIVYLLLRKRL